MSRAPTPAQTVRATGALALANARYWTSVAPLVRARLSLWEERAGAIPDPVLQTLATGKLREERFNVEVAATLATVAPRPRRAGAVEAIVALQVAYDYLDALTERPAADELLPDPVSDGRRLLRALSDAFAPPGEPSEDYYRGLPRSQDGGYLRELVDGVRRSLARLPAAGAIAEVARRTALRCAEAQALGHAAAGRGCVEVERWARAEAEGSALGWPEALAGAQASVLTLHALIAAAADERTTREQAERIDAAYGSIAALTMLDSLVDREQDFASGALAYGDLYGDPERMSARLAAVARDAARRTRALPHGAHHLMTLAGVVAYYASAPGADEAFARVAIGGVREELRPLISPTLAVMRAWRLAKRRRTHRGGDLRNGRPAPSH